jgi:hypothetical protein
MKIIITENRLNSVALKWLDNEFGNLTKLVKGDRTFYIDQDGLPLFMYYQNKKDGFVYINYDKIWILLKTIFGMEYQQMKEILIIWLEQTYKITGYTPFIDSENYRLMLEQTYKII